MAIVLILVVLVVIAGGAAFFFKSRGGGSDTPTTGSVSPLGSSTTEPMSTRSADVEDTAPARVQTPAPELDDLLAAPAAAPPAVAPPASAPPAVAPPAAAPPAVAPPAAAQEAPPRPVEHPLADEVGEEEAGFDRFGAPGTRLKKQVGIDPMAPKDRVYDMELVDGESDTAHEQLAPLPPAMPPADPTDAGPEPSVAESAASDPVAPDPISPRAPEREPQVLEETEVAGAIDFEEKNVEESVKFAYGSLIETQPTGELDEPEPAKLLEADVNAEMADPSAPLAAPETKPFGASDEEAPELAEPAAVATGRDTTPEPASAVPPRDAVDHVLQALITRAQDRKVALAQVAAELVEQANLEDREIDEVLGDLIAVAPEERENVDPNERLEELTMFNDAVPKRPGQINAFDQLGASDKKRVIIRVLCLLVALQEDYKLQPSEPASEAETRSWPLARAVWPVNAKADDESEQKPIQRRKGRLAKSR